MCRHLFFQAASATAAICAAEPSTTGVCHSTIIDTSLTLSTSSPPFLFLVPTLFQVLDPNRFLFQVPTLYPYPLIEFCWFGTGSRFFNYLKSCMCRNQCFLHFIFTFFFFILPFYSSISLMYIFFTLNTDYSQSFLCIDSSLTEFRY